MANQKDDFNLFSDKRFRETRLRRSVVSIDDTDFLMKVRDDRRRSIISMNTDDTGVPWNRVWNSIPIPPDNLRNILPLNRNSGGSRATSVGESEDTDEDTDAISKNLAPNLQKLTQDTESEATTDESCSNGKSSLNSSISSLKTSGSSSFSSLLESPKPSTAATISMLPRAQQQERPAWYTRLGAISKLERRQEKSYHDTLDERHEAATVEATAVKTSWNWNRQRKQNNSDRGIPNHRGSSPDGLDFRRDVMLANRQDSIYAMADSVTRLPSMADFNDDDDDANENMKTGYMEDIKLASNPKTKQCVLDLIM